jgi:glycosyltransferase involved in cell wall biosynthesis
MSNEKLPISAILVGYNEAKFLSSCFEGINFCDEILYFDLGSTDNSLEIAIKYGATIIQHERVLSCEWIHAKFADKTKHEWVLITDPDEVIDISLAQEINQLFNIKGIEKNVGAIMAPWIFYFRNKQLKGTPWGGTNKRVLLVNNKRFVFSAQIHVGRKLKDEYEYMDIPMKCHNVIHHYWMQGYHKLLEKHLRYLKNEGEARYNSGLRTSLKQILKEPLKAFKISFFSKQGYKDGLLGFSLSVFWAWYQTSAQMALYRYQKSMQIKKQP